MGSNEHVTSTPNVEVFRNMTTGAAVIYQICGTVHVRPEDIPEVIKALQDIQRLNDPRASVVSLRLDPSKAEERDFTDWQVVTEDTTPSDFSPEMYEVEVNATENSKHPDGWIPWNRFLASLDSDFDWRIRLRRGGAS